MAADRVEERDGDEQSEGHLHDAKGVDEQVALGVRDLRQLFDASGAEQAVVMFGDAFAAVEAPDRQLQPDRVAAEQHRAQLRVVARDPHLAAHVKPLAALGQLDIVRGDVTHAASVARAVAGSDGVVNLVGILSGSEGAGFDAVHIGGAGNIAAASAAAGVHALVHVSALGADVESASAYGRSKGKGETAVRAAFPAATILRPSVIFGAEDQFLNRFAGLLRAAPVMPVVAGDTRFQPVYVTDVADAVARALAAPAAHGGGLYALGGPDTMTMRALLEWIAETIGRNPRFIDVPDAVAGLVAALTGWLPGAPLTRDQWLMLQSDNVVAPKAKGLKALVKPEYRVLFPG